MSDGAGGAESTPPPAPDQGGYMNPHPLDTTTALPSTPHMPWWRPTPIWDAVVAELGDPR